MKYTYRTQGTCSQAIEFEIVDGILKNVQFYGGCNGNTQGVATLVEGMKAENCNQNANRIISLRSFLLILAELNYPTVDVTELRH